MILLDILALIYVTLLSKMVFNELFIFLFSASLWIPQIIFNTKKGIKGVPSFDFAVS
jgi:hypothetical protein